MPKIHSSLYKIIFHTPFVLFLMVVLSSCNSNNDNEPTLVKKVLLVYLGGDNNLSYETDEKFNAITDGWDKSVENKILIYQDAQGRKPQLTEVGGKFSEMYSQENSASPETFKRVLAKAKSLYPTAEFNLLVFSHASGWLPSGELNKPNTRSIIIDGKDEMELTDFASAIPDGMFHTIVFEACFMAGIEVAYELKDKTHYIAASSAEILSPGFTPLYKDYVNLLFQENTQEFMQAAFNFYNSQSGAYRSATFSIVNTKKLDALIHFIRTNAKYNPEINPNTIQIFDRNKNFFYDFEDYFAQLLADDTQKQTLKNLIEECVVWKIATPAFMQRWHGDENGFKINKHSGMTTYIINPNKPHLTEAYKKLKWSKAITN